MRRTYRKRFRRQKPEKRHRVNRQIRVPEVSVIDEEGTSLGVMRTEDAGNLAQERGYDMVEVSPLAKPPVVKFLDYGSFKYQEEKRKQKARLQQKEKQVEVKAVRLTFRIGEHDKEVRKKAAIKFLEGNDKVKIEMTIRGREHQHIDLAKEKVNQFIEEVNQIIPVEIEQSVTKQGGKLLAIIYGNPQHATGSSASSSTKNTNPTSV